jgi:hypothetical protein
LRNHGVAQASATWCPAHVLPHGHLTVVDGPGTDDFAATYHLPVVSRTGLREFLSRLLPEHYSEDAPGAQLPDAYLSRLVRELAPGLPEEMPLEEADIYQAHRQYLYRMLIEFLWIGPWGG